MNSNHRTVFSFTIILFACFVVGCGEKPPPPAPPPPVSIATYEVKAGDATYYNQYPGTIAALNEVQILPQVSGYITGIHFKDGQQVTKGMKLYSIDQQQYQAGVDQSVANLNVAKANLARAQQDADRYLDLQKKDAIARQVVDHALADLQTAKMQVSAAEANVRNVQTGLRYSNIYSPLTGTIGISLVKMGAAVSPGVTLLNTVSSDDPVAVDVAVDEKDITRFISLQKTDNKAKDSAFTLNLPGGETYPIPGTIALIDRAVDPQTGTIKVRLSFPNKEKTLKPGMSATVRILNNGGTQQLLIPYKSVVEQMGEYFVYVVQADTVVQRGITLGTRIGENIIVQKGLESGEKIATEGIQKLRTGSAVKSQPRP
ncbi:MAG: efflux RND transporter periplasmic adaptor subunit [Gemmatimonadaceae bacterium]|nr:efflux RND transporter periplasmic adaptor subunit [Chitinophagaceae bacterium]